MKPEYDLTNELGPKNWIDCAAGEAVVIGHVINDPELVAHGTMVAGMAKEIRFNDDNFALVEALAIDIQTKLESIKSQEKTCLFIDDLFEGDVKRKPLDKWEYDLIYCGGRYEIRMVLPRYDASTPIDTRRKLIREEVRNHYKDFETFRTEDEEVDFKTQVFKITKYFNDKNELVCKLVDHDHEGGWYRGWMEIFYFESFEEAWAAWLEAKEIYEKKG